MEMAVVVLLCLKYSSLFSKSAARISKESKPFFDGILMALGSYCKNPFGDNLVKYSSGFLLSKSAARIASFFSKGLRTKSYYYY